MTSATAVVPRWSDTALAALADTMVCPRCAATLDSPSCRRCGADYSGPIGSELWRASQTAIDALHARQQVLDRVPTRQRPDASTVPQAAPPKPPLSRATRRSATVQSVLAVAGAGLVAVAAIVFSFFTPDLGGALRGAVLGTVTVVFICGALMLVRQGLRSSAEAVAALGAVFVGLDVHALATATDAASVTAWAVAAGGSVIGGVLLCALALRARLRAWLAAGAVALTLVPAMVGYAANAPVVGHLGVALVAFALLGTRRAVARRIGAPLRSETATLTVIEVCAIIVAPVHGVLFGALWSDSLALSLSAVLASSAVLAAFSTAHAASRMWGVLSGAFATAAVAVGVFAIDVPEVWLVATLPAGVVLGAIVITTLAPLPRTADVGFVAGGALIVVAAVALQPTGMAIILGAGTVLGWDSLGLDAVATASGLTALAVGLIAFAWLRERRRPPIVPDGGPPPLGTRWVGAVGLWYGMLALLVVLTVPTIVLPARIALGLVLAATLAIGARRIPALRPAAVRVPLITGAHALTVTAAVLSWQIPGTAPSWAIAVIVAVTAIGAVMPAGARFVYVAIGYAYALVAIAVALAQTGLSAVAVMCLTTSVAALSAIIATFTPRVSVRGWYAVLMVTAVPFVLGVAQVVVERSGWTALSTSLVFLLAVALVQTRRRGLVRAIRVLAAGILVPSLAVVIVCLGAQILLSSGSPVVLPLIAVLVASVLPLTGRVRALVSQRIGGDDATAVRVAIETSTLVTAAITAALALLREAAGLPTATMVFVILAAGGVLTATVGRRRYGWWMAGVAGTGALWAALALAHVPLAAIEAYVLPPAITLALVGAILVWHRGRGASLMAVGLGVAILPLVALVPVAPTPVRGVALVAAAWGLAAIGTWFGRGRSARGEGERMRVLARVTFAAVLAASVAGALQGARYGVGIDSPPAATPAVIAALGIAGLAATAALGAARGLRTVAEPRSRWVTTRWLSAVGFAVLTTGVWPAIERDWFTIWTMWALMLAVLGALVVASARGLRAGTGLPPVWFLFALAFITAVVAWSPRDLRVEWFSLPLGAALLVAGWMALRAVTAVPPKRSVTAWPATWHGSWALLAPGLVVTLSASIAATFTDPLTWRAILVIVLALGAILVGASGRLAAPFVVGIVVLPVENVLAFAVQIGRGIDAMPWWITLAVVGAVLLIIAMTYERRAGEQGGLVARLRDLT
ncbi:SCO7613 C-terminal domain-containing membrane protein [Microbacterium koreense]|uniref:SCO7613 C-terminal domain-containing membrane protein n=1 Tax=Microbacterium koreense TaxID=323761 RepID=A0ABW2ZMK8_9MICO